MAEKVSQISVITSQAAFQAHKTFFTVLRLAGLFFIKDKPCNIQISEDAFTKPVQTSRWHILAERFWFGYSTIVTIMVVAYAFPVGSIFAYQVEKDVFGNLVLNGLIFLWYLSGAVPCCIMYYKLVTGQVSRYFISWVKLRFAPAGEQLRRKATTAFRISLFEFGLFYSLYLFFYLASRFWPTPELGIQLIRNRTVPTDPHLKANLPYLVFRTLSSVFCVAAELLVPLFFSSICASIIIQFETLTKQLKQEIRMCNAGAKKRINIEFFRVGHKKLCMLVKEADGLFSFFNLCAIIINMAAQLCAIMTAYYFREISAHDWISSGCLIVLFLSFVVRTMITVVGGWRIDDAVRLPLDILYQLDQTDLDERTINHVQTFLHQLTQPKLGFTAFGIFAVNAEAVLMLAQIYLTYQILLFQVQVDQGQSREIESSMEHVLSKYMNSTCWIAQ